MVNLALRETLGGTPFFKDLFQKVFSQTYSKYVCNKPIIVNTKYLIIVNSGKLRFHMACTDGQFDYE